MADDYSLRESIFRNFLKNPTFGPSEMTELLGAKYNSVKAAFAKLAEDGLLIRSGRGNYEPNIAGILLYLIDKIEIIEKKVK